MFIDVSISARGCDPPLFARAFNFHAKIETMTVLLLAFRCIGYPHLFVRRLTILGSLESGASARAIFITREHKSTNWTRVTSVCAR